MYNVTYHGAIRSTVSDDFVPLALNGQGGRTKRVSNDFVPFAGEEGKTKTAKGKKRV